MQKSANIFNLSLQYLNIFLIFSLELTYQVDLELTSPLFHKIYPVNFDIENW